MTRRRYTADQLTPVTRDELPTFERQDDPTYGTTRSAWAAWSLCGAWAYLRADTTGTPWQLQHRATGYITDEIWPTLDDARYSTAQPDIWRVLWDDALWVLDRHPEVAVAPAVATPTDEARALLTWLVEHDHAPSRLDPVNITG